MWEYCHMFKTMPTFMKHLPASVDLRFSTPNMPISYHTYPTYMQYAVDPSSIVLVIQPDCYPSHPVQQS